MWKYYVGGHVLLSEKEHGHGNRLILTRGPAYLVVPESRSR